MFGWYSNDFLVLWYTKISQTDYAKLKSFCVRTVEKFQIPKYREVPIPTMDLCVRYFRCTTLIRKYRNIGTFSSIGNQKSSIGIYNIGRGQYRPIDLSAKMWYRPIPVLKTRRNLSVVLRATYFENLVALTKSKYSR